MVEKGDRIHAIDENRTLIVEGLWGNSSKVVDFSAVYINAAGITANGEILYGDRGFRFQDEGKIWEKINR